MFDNLSDRLGNVFDRLRGRGALNETDVREAMREVRVALLEADDLVSRRLPVAAGAERNLRRDALAFLDLLQDGGVRVRRVGDGAAVVADHRLRVAGRSDHERRAAAAAFHRAHRHRARTLHLAQILAVQVL